MSETPTPETDAMEVRIVPSRFARRLERERDAARRERDEARRELDLVSDKLCKSESAYLKNEEIIDGLKNEIEHTETFFREKLSRAADDVNEAKRERDDFLNELVAARDGWSKALEERDEARRSLKHIEEYGAEKINAAVSLRQELTKAMETDWTAIGYREGMSAALHSGGIRGSKWHAERKGLQGEAADNYISGFNAALDEYEQEEAK